MLAHLAASRPLTIQSPFSVLNQDAKAKAASWPVRGGQALLAQPGLFHISQKDICSLIMLQERLLVLIEQGLLDLLPLLQQAGM